MDEERRARGEAIAARAAADDRRRAAERVRAQRMIDEFMQAMRARGVPPVPLRARVGDGRTTYRTGRTGWYLRRNKTVAIGADGAFLILTVPASVRSWLTGVDVEPSDPPLIVGRGGRDGEAVELAALLAQRLDDPVR